MTSRGATLLRIVVLVATAGAFALYLRGRGEVVRQLLDIPNAVVVDLLGLYLLWFAAQAAAGHVTLRLCRRSLSIKEQLSLSAYSTLVNFFIPGQGGPAVRGLYLKKRLGLSIRSYVLATLVHYACYAAVSGAMLVNAARPGWGTTLSLMAIVIAGGIVVQRYLKHVQLIAERIDLSSLNLGILLLASLVQALIQSAVYGYELRYVNPKITLTQILAYTGAANFSLFVALTPGAIGIRETFLFVSKGLHEVDTQLIVAASLIDRAVFFLFLGLLFVSLSVSGVRKFGRS